MTIIKYYTARYGNSIKKVELSRETEKTVFHKSGRREAKVSDYCIYHDTWTEAHTHLVKQRTRALDIAKLKMASAEKDLCQVLALKEEN